MDNNQVTALSVIDSIDTNVVARTMDKIHAFQQVIQQAVKPGHDIGIIPGTDKPTLLKPGAEKIVMMMGLASRYEIMDKVEDYDKGFFSYNIRCTLSRQGMDICEGVGNCNSRESKYVKADPYSIANTILKMAKKRAYVDAALSVASLSDIFTQDLEDMPDMRISSGPSHRDNQGKPLLEQTLTFGKHKGRTFADLLENERGYLEWLAHKSDNQKWGPIAQQVLEGATDDTASETADLDGIPASVTKMAYRIGMTDQDLLNFIQGVCGKPWGELSGTEKNSIIEQLQDLSQ
jgi:uncharacterized protein (DUF3820 family)